MTDEEDFFGDAIESTSDNANTQQVMAAFKALMEAEANLEMLREQVAGETAIVTKMKNDRLPELLKEMGTELWKDPETGTVVELETAVNSALPKDMKKRNELLDALRPIGIEQILAEEFTINFMPNDPRVHIIRAILGLEPQDDVFEDEDSSGRLTNHQAELVHQLRESLELGDLPAAEKLGCHAATLKKFLKETLDGGDAEKIKAIDDAGIWHGKHAKVKKPRGKK